jgi:hypothetical protein
VSTFYILFAATLGNYNPTFDGLFSEEDPNRGIGAAIILLYIVFAGIVLLSLVIARYNWINAVIFSILASLYFPFDDRLSAAHDSIDNKSFQEWRFLRAKTTKQFLLVEERSPFSMLPPPLNLVSPIISIVDFVYIKILKGFFSIISLSSNITS